MENLINKAIKAIGEQKYDYAIGLLEGILEMNGYEKRKGTIYEYDKLPPFDLSSQPINTYVDTRDSDEGNMLDAVAKARLESITKDAHIEIL